MLLAARTSFGEFGFDGATIRHVAAGTGVDPALVQRYLAVDLTGAERLDGATEAGELVT